MYLMCLSRRTVHEYVMYVVRMRLLKYSDESRCLVWNILPFLLLTARSLPPLRSTALFGRSNRTTHFIKGRYFDHVFMRAQFGSQFHWLVSISPLSPMDKQCGLEMTNTSFQKSADNVAWIKYLWKEMFQGSEQFLGVILKIVLRMLKQ